MFELGDADRDGEIDLQEFIAVMTTSSPVPYAVSNFIIFFIIFLLRFKID